MPDLSKSLVSRWSWRGEKPRERFLSSEGRIIDDDDGGGSGNDGGGGGDGVCVCVYVCLAGRCWVVLARRRGQTCHRPCIPVQAFSHPLVTFLRLFHKQASGVLTEALPSPTKAREVKSRDWEQVRTNPVWGGALKVLRNLITQARCRG